MVASGLPAYVLLGLLMSGRDETAAWVLGVGGVVLTLAGLVLLARSGSRQAGRLARALEPAADVGDEQGDEDAAGHGSER